jgi:hypothetical protein
MGHASIRPDSDLATISQRSFSRGRRADRGACANSVPFSPGPQRYVAATPSLWRSAEQEEPLSQASTGPAGRGVRVTSVVTGADYQLVWPRELFRSEAYALVNNTQPSDWTERCHLLLEDAFAGEAPRDDFSALSTELERQKFLASLLRRTDVLKEASTDRVPYWSERQRSRQPGAVSLLATAREFVRIIDDLERRGYFEKAFDKDCADVSTPFENWLWHSFRD